MANAKTCHCGHQWEADDDSPRTCPACGDSTIPFIDVHDENRTSDYSPAATPVVDAPDVPGFEIIHELGRGGMGVVYFARQISLKRFVALKMIRNGAGLSVNDRARFLSEAEAVARLTHPNIIQIFEIGTFCGNPFISVEYAPGGTLRDRLGGDPVPALASARLIETLSRAIQHAHEMGIIHRDLKPGNILLASEAGPIEEALPKIADFGIAKISDTEGATETDAILGTPSYMSPEQAFGHAKRVGPAADVYALGVILYELLTGRTPFKSASKLETLELVRNHDPIPPSSLQPSCPKDLETVCLKCLQKNPHHRYASASDLADDLRRFREGHPVLARPIMMIGRISRWCRRNPRVAILAGSTSLLLFTLLIVSAIGYIVTSNALTQESHALSQAKLDRRDAETARTNEAAKALEAERERDRFARLLYLREIDTAGSAALSSGDVGQLEEVLARSKPAPNRPDPRGWEYGFLTECSNRLHASLRGHIGAVDYVAFSPDGKWLASGDVSGSIKIWNSSDWNEVGTLLEAYSKPPDICWSKDGQWLSILGVNGPTFLWNRSSMKIASKSPSVVEWAFTARAWNQNHQASNTAKGDLTIRDRQTSLIVQTIPAPPRLTPRAWSPSGKLLAATSGTGGVLVVLDGSTGAKVMSVQATSRYLGGLIRNPVWSPDEKMICWTYGDTTFVWDIATARTVREVKFILMNPPFDNRACTVWSPDSRRIAFRDRELRVIDVATGRESTFYGHKDSVRAIAWSPDGRYIVSSSLDRILRVWDAGNPSDPIRNYELGHSIGFRPAFSPDGKLMTLQHWRGNAPGHVEAWNFADSLASTQQFSGPTKEINATAFRPDGRQLAAAEITGAIYVWDIAGELVWKAPSNPEVGIQSLSWSPDGRQIAAGGAKDPRVNIWDAETGKVMFSLIGHTDRIRTAVFSSDGRRLATGSDDRSIRIWDLTTRLTIAILNGHGNFVTSLAWANDGRLASSGADGTVRLWDINKGELRQTLRGHLDDWVGGLDWNPDRTRLVSCDSGGGIIIWDALTGQPALRYFPQFVTGAAVSWRHEGKSIAIASFSGRVTVLDAGTSWLAP